MWILLKPFLPYIAMVVLCASIYVIGHVEGNAGCEIRNAKITEAALQRGENEHAKIEDAVSGATPTANRNGLRLWSRGN